MASRWCDEVADVLVVGYGSDLRRDDAVGRRVAEVVDRCRLPGVAVIARTQLVPELVEQISQVRQVVFVDASCDARTVTARPLSPGPSSTNSHHVTPEDLLHLVASLDRDCPAAFVVEVPAPDLSLGDGLSDLAAAQVPSAVDTVIDLCVTTRRDLSRRRVIDDR